MFLANGLFRLGFCTGCGLDPSTTVMYCSLPIDIVYVSESRLFDSSAMLLTELRLFLR
jgi:hypothetical protein